MYLSFLKRKKSNICHFLINTKLKQNFSHIFKCKLENKFYIKSDVSMSLVPSVKNFKNLNDIGKLENTNN